MKMNMDDGVAKLLEIFFTFKHLETPRFGKMDEFPIKNNCCRFVEFFWKLLPTFLLLRDMGGLHHFSLSDLWVLWVLRVIS